MRLMDRYAVSIQPAGSAGTRRVFVTISGKTEDNDNLQLELVLSEEAANNLGEALISGAVGVMRDIDGVPPDR